MLIALVAAGCGKEKKNESTEPESFAFTIYPGSKYLAQLTDLWKQARKVFRPNDDVPPIAIYDTDAPLDKVAEFYAQSYGYNKVAPDATNNLSSAKPPAYYRTGDLSKDVAGIVPVAVASSVAVPVFGATFILAIFSTSIRHPLVICQRSLVPSSDEVFQPMKIPR